MQKQELTGLWRLQQAGKKLGETTRRETPAQRGVTGYTGVPGVLVL